uniref:TEA domain transcription factor 4 n=1 Tax=Ursus maritimus TaxID=29073 RepID=A0A384D7P5_URSMA
MLRECLGHCAHSTGWEARVYRGETTWIPSPPIPPDLLLHSLSSGSLAFSLQALVLWMAKQRKATDCRAWHSPGCPVPWLIVLPPMLWFLPKQVQRALLQAEPWRARPAPLPPTSGALLTPLRGATSLGAVRLWTSPSTMTRRVCGVRTLSRASRRPWPSTRPAAAARSSCQTRARCTFWQGALPGQAGTSHDVKPFSQQTYTVQPSLPLPGFESPAGPTPSPSAPPAPPWQGRSVASSKLWMLEFSAFLEQQQDPDTYNKHLFVHIGQSSPSYSDPYLEAVDIRQIYDKFPEKKGGLKELFERGPSNAFFLVKFWADLNTNIEDEGSSFYGVSSQYESPENMIITCSTKVCSFGKQVVEKVETEYARYENGHYSYRIHRSPLCEYMINFIHKLKHLPEKYMMNSVLENFTILQVVTNRDTQETLLCVAYVFEVSASEHGAQHHIYRLVKE